MDSSMSHHSTDLLNDTLMIDDFAPDIDLLDDILGIEYDWKELEPTILQNNTLLTPKQEPQQQLLAPHPQPLHFPPQQQQQQQQLLFGQSQSQSVDQKVQLQPSQFSFAGLTGQIYTTGNNTTLILPPQMNIAAVLDNHEQHKIPMKRLVPFELSSKEEKTPPSITGSKRRSKGGHTPAAPSRRSSHNAIERRYRSSINDKILELKSLVCHNSEPSEKVHKAAILRNSIDTIKYLQNNNARADKENRILKQAINSNRTCVSCGADQPPITVPLPPTTDLRDLLTDNSPPPTSDSDSSQPATPTSPQQQQNNSPIALFAIAAGLFLINPVSHYHPTTNSKSTEMHSRVERSIDSNFITAPAHSNLNIGLTLFINFLLFLAIYYISGRLFRKKRNLKEKKVIDLEELTSVLNTKSEKQDKLVKFIEKVTGEKFPKNNLFMKLKNYYLTFSAPISLYFNTISHSNSYSDSVSKCYVELGKLQAENSLAMRYCGLKSLISLTNEENLLSTLTLIRSKFILRLVLVKLKNSAKHPLLTGEFGLNFFKSHLKNIQNINETCNVLTEKVSNDQVAKLVHKFKFDMIWKGVQDLFFNGGAESTNYFKAAINAVKYEKSNGEKNSGSGSGAEWAGDMRCEWWSCVLWCQSEWMTRGGRAPILQRLYKVIDTLWKEQEDDPICRAVYFTHLAKRSLAMDSAPLSSVRRLTESAAEALRDSINLTTDKPKPVMQLIWSLVAEWILEIRLELWEEMYQTDSTFTAQFSRDLDTLRSLTHYLPSLLPSVYLYEACLRLMSRASPSRTQQLLDASLRSVRLNTRSGLICTNNNSAAILNEGEVKEEKVSCNRMKKGENLVREKRKAMALYLRCKHLPSQVITCPGEKAGMLREALKAMEKFGEFKKIQHCLEMIKQVGAQALTIQ